MDYDYVYADTQLYWGETPSKLCYKVLELCPPLKRIKILDIGAGEGRNSLFFARNGYDVTSIEISGAGIKKIQEQAKENNLFIQTIQCDFADFEFKETEKYDVILSVGSMHYINIEKRPFVFTRMKQATTDNGLNVIRTFVNKPYLIEDRSPEETENLFRTGELMSYYYDWNVLLINEDEKNCCSGGKPHKHVRNTIITRKVGY